MKKEIQVLEHTSEIIHGLSLGALLNTQDGLKINSMAIGAGMIGLFWNRPILIVFVRQSRYTHELLEASGEFTVSVPTEKLDPRIMHILGSESGRTEDKIAKAGLTPVPGDRVQAPGFAEIPLTLECRVIYRQTWDRNALDPAYAAHLYGNPADPSVHMAFYGEVLKAYTIE